MARKIMVDPAMLIDAAGKMDEQVGQYDQQYKKLFDDVDGMGQAWSGADNQAFVGQIKGFMDDFQKMSTLMKQYSQFLKDSAKTYKDTQQEIITKAKTLSN